LLEYRGVPNLPIAGMRACRSAQTFQREREREKERKEKKPPDLLIS